MDELRSGRKEVDDTIVRALLRANDVLNDHVTAARGAGPAVDPARSQSLIAELETLTHGAPVSTAEGASDSLDDDFGFVPVALSLDDFGAGDPLPPLDLHAVPDIAPASEPTGWKIIFRPHPRLYANANETALLIRELGRLGPVEVSLDDSGLPELDALDPMDSHLVWTIQLNAPVSEADVRDVFDFVESDCDLNITPLAGASVDDGLPPLAPVADLGLPDLSAPVADLPELGGSTEADIAALVALAQADTAARLGGGEAKPANDEPAVLAAAPIDAPKPVAATTAPAAAKAAPVAAAPVTIRVDLERVDRLINAVGELVIQQAMLAQRVYESGLARSSDISLGLEDLELLTREIQDSVMAIRAQPVKSVFQRMPRLVREVADMTGKRVKLVTTGEDTEVDKTVVERLAEPITHMLRNAIDHGLESPEEREAAGKPVEGTVKLAALHRSGRIVIEISDDGKGINRQRVRAIAEERGLVTPDQTLSDDEVDNLIFLPGFSTAETITDVSGRGVGMDVVRRSIQALGGRISISSVPGKGSTFTLSLPLTLAVLDGMVVGAAGQTLVSPLSAIVESLTPKEADIHYVGGTDAVIRFREEFVPLVDVALVMGFREDPTSLTSGVVMIVETESGNRAALAVDTINGQRQVVIKSLETNYRHVEGVSAATILGDGSVALILDIDSLVTAGRRKPNRSELKMAS